MSYEIVLSGANLVLMLGYLIRTENRLTKLETKIDVLFQRRRQHDYETNDE